MVFPVYSPTFPLPIPLLSKPRGTTPCFLNLQIKKLILLVSEKRGRSQWYPAKQEFLAFKRPLNSSYSLVNSFQAKTLHWPRQTGSMMACTLTAKKNSQTKCNDRITKASLAVSVISLITAAMLFARIEVIHRRAKSEETTLENRIQRIENDMQVNVQRMVQAMLQSTVVPISSTSSERNGKTFGEYCSKENCDFAISGCSVKVLLRI